MTTASEIVLVDRHEHVLLLTMNRPAQRNAFDNAMYRAMTVALETARADDAVRVVVITGAGETFCAGQDFAEMSAAAGTAHG
ncbi:MAG: enoyl-CoA hydratase/isomerase family protein, partial [bacterium]